MFKNILIFLVMFNLGSTQIENEVKIIKNVAKTLKEPPFFIILGFNKPGQITLVEELSSANYQSVAHDKTVTSFPSTYPQQNNVFLLNLNSNLSSILLNQANTEHLFCSPLKWIVFNTHEVTRNITEITETYFRGLTIFVDSEFLFVYKIDDKKYLLVMLYKRNKDTAFSIDPYGTWDSDLGLVRENGCQITAVRRHNLMQIQLRTAIVITQNDSLNHLTDYRDKHIDSITKVNYILVRHLADTVNASLTYTIKDSWGYINNYSKWTGMIGDLVDDRADIGGTPLFVTSDRIDIIDYIAMTTATKSNFVFREPKLSYVTNVFTLPFHWTVWISSAALIALTTLGLAIMLKWEKVSEKQELVELEPKDAMLISIGATCQQGASAVPNLASGRILTLFIFVSLMFLFTSYSANIVALLQSSSNSIKTLKDLLKSRLSVGVHDTVFNRFYFPAATEPVRRALFLQKVEPPHQAPRFFTIEEGVRRIRQGLFAFHMEGGSGYKLVSETFYEDEKCDLQEISFLQVPDPFLAIQKNSSYKELLKIGLRKIQESGIQSREVARVYTKKPQCHGRGSSFVSVGLIDIYSAVEVFAMGVTTSIFVFILEVLIHRKYNKNKIEKHP